MLATRSRIAWLIHQAFDESAVFAPYSKGFEAQEDFTMNTDRQGRIKDFYAKPIFTQTAAAVVTTSTTIIPGQANNQTAQPAAVIEFVDEDEPSIGDDL